ncbi:MAG: phosphotransferase [Deltaproteobacteria bacterium]|nr:phosphotransferase [Deltaproteobacteria bacterium]
MDFFSPLLSRMLAAPAPAFELKTLKGDASSRRYHRLTLAPGTRPRSIVVMELPEEATRSDEVVSGAAPAELPFLDVGRHLAAAGLRVPRILLDAVPERAVLLEDLGDETLERRLAARPDQMGAWYGAAADLLATMHARMWPMPRDSIAATRAFDAALVRWELDHYREWGAEALAGRPLDAGVRAALDAAFDTLTAEIAALPVGFVHRDYQSRNLMVIGDMPCPASLAIIDFQDALAGPRVYDLVALLCDSYIEIPQALRRATIARYAEKTGILAADLGREFDLVAVQRKLKDGGRFVFIDRVKGNPSFLPYVDRSFALVREHLGRLPGHAALKSALAAAAPASFEGVV